MLGLIAASLLACAAPDAPRTQVHAGDLLSLREISGLSVSPDGRLIAFQVQQADALTNRYASVWCVADSTGDGAALALGDGGEMAMPSLSGLGRASGVWATLAARWSPDSARFAVLARRHGQTQIEVCTLASRACERVSQSVGDVEDLVWSADGAALIYRAGPSRVAIAEALAREGARGFHFDDRFDVYHSLIPVRTSEGAPAELRRLDVTSGADNVASADDRALFATNRRAPFATGMGSSRILSLIAAAPVTPPPLPQGRDVRQVERLGRDGAVWLEPPDRTRAGMVPPLRLYARAHEDAAVLECASSWCEGRIVEFAPTPDGASVLFIRREGWGFSEHGLYLWTLGDNQVRRRLVSDDVIRVCTPLNDRAICLHEGSIAPRSIAAISYRDGARTTLFDANPHLPQSSFVAARKLTWRSPTGEELFGYLLTPPSMDGARAPLIVVQYRATGLLRGGVGDEYPIQAFARAGFAVLALERPDPSALMARERDARAFDRAEWRDLSERRRTLEALRSGIDQVVALGLADPARVGVTGLSDGAETAVFAAIHCGCAAAFSITGGIHDPISLYLTSDVRRREMRADGRGESAFGEGARWSELSLALNAQAIRTPILAHVADRELLFTLQAQRSFADLGRPFDLYVFPDEYHVKWQPAHRAAVYERNLDWFSFWLMGVDQPDPGEEAEFARWRAWRDARASEDLSAR